MSNGLAKEWVCVVLPLWGDVWCGLALYGTGCYDLEEVYWQGKPIKIDDLSQFSFQIPSIDGKPRYQPLDDYLAEMSLALLRM
ncbi:MAG: hypothetical protein ACOYK8_10015 [Alphaproteobacteria bacterium]